MTAGIRSKDYQSLRNRIIMTVNLFLKYSVDRIAGFSMPASQVNGLMEHDVMLATCAQRSLEVLDQLM